MKNILIINGPNLNLLGKREPTVYGSQDFESFFSELSTVFEGKLALSYFQSNHEGAIIDKIHEVGFELDGIIINAGGLTHTSVALRDAIAGVTTDVLEVHISNTHAREDFRHHSYLSAVCKGVILGFGLKSYELALQSFI